LYSSPNIRNIELKIRWAGHVECMRGMGEYIRLYSLVGKNCRNGITRDNHTQIGIILNQILKK